MQYLFVISSAQLSLHSVFGCAYMFKFIAGWLLLSYGEREIEGQTDKLSCDALSKTGGSQSLLRKNRFGRVPNGNPRSDYYYGISGRYYVRSSISI